MKKPQVISVGSPECRQFIEELKGRVLSAGLSVARAVNRDMIMFYWNIGRAILEGGNWATSLSPTCLGMRMGGKTYWSGWLNDVIFDAK